jgi:acetyl esterase/lipase
LTEAVHVDAGAAGNGEPDWEARRREALREQEELFASEGRVLAAVGAVADEHVEVAGGAIRVRIYTPRGTGPFPAVVHLHGGGFALFSIDWSVSVDWCRDVCARVGAVVVDVDYRLAPEHPFPTGFEDCYSALSWMAENAAELGIDASRLAVGGESAGGGLSAAVALAARDRGGPALAFQLLLYPVLDDSLTTHSVQTMTDAPMFDARNSVLMWEHYLGPVAERGAVSPYAAPARAAGTERGLAGLPPAYILACEHDPLRDEELAYAAELALAGVPVELHLVPGTFHGFDGFPTQVGKRITAEYLDSLRRAVGS